MISKGIVTARSSRRKLGRLGATLCLALLLVASASIVTTAQEKTLHLQRYDIDIEIYENGDFRVEETQEMVFTSGVFTWAERYLSLKQAVDYSDITVREEDGPTYHESSSGKPYTYSMRQEEGNLYIKCYFPPSSDTHRTIVRAYTVKGALRHYPDYAVDQLFWKVIPPGNPFPVKTTTITVHLPEGTWLSYVAVMKGAVRFDAGDSGKQIWTMHRDDKTGMQISNKPEDSLVTFTALRPLEANQQVQVLVEWSRGSGSGYLPEKYRPQTEGAEVPSWLGSIPILGGVAFFIMWIIHWIRRGAFGRGGGGGGDGGEEAAAAGGCGGGGCGGGGCGGGGCGGGDAG